MGLNQSAETQVRELREHGPKQDLQATLNTTVNGDVKFGDKQFDLSTGAGIDAFTASLEISGPDAAEKRKRLGALLRSVELGTRDEIAGLIVSFSRADIGKIRMEELILSG